LGAAYAHGEADAIGQLLKARHEDRAAVGAAVHALLPGLEALRGAAGASSGVLQP